MAIKYLGSNLITGLAGDTKPTNVATGSRFFETDTKNEFYFDGASWVDVGPVADISVYPYSTTIGDYTTPNNAISSGDVSVNMGTADIFVVNLGGSMTNSRAGERITDTTLRNKVFKSVTFRLIKTGSPTGTANVRIRNANDDSIVGTLGTIDVSTLTGSAASYTVTHLTGITSPAAADFRLTIEFTGGDTNNYISAYMHNANPYTGGQKSLYAVSWTDDSAQETTGSFIYSTDTQPSGNALDGNTGTAYESVSSVNPWLRLELSSAADKDPAALALYMHANTTCTALAIECSDDSVTWVLARTVNVNLLTNGAYNYFRFNRGAKAYRYIRIRGTDAGAKVLAISEVKVLIPTESQFNRRHGHKVISTSDGTWPLTA